MVLPSRFTIIALLKKILHSSSQSLVITPNQKALLVPVGVSFTHPRRYPSICNLLLVGIFSLLLLIIPNVIDEDLLQPRNTYSFPPFIVVEGDIVTFCRFSILRLLQDFHSLKTCSLLSLLYLMVI